MVATAGVVCPGSRVLFCLTDPPQDPAADSDAKLHKDNRLLDGKSKLGATYQHPDTPFSRSVRRGLPLSF